MFLGVEKYQGNRKKRLDFAQVMLIVRQVVVSGTR